MGNFKDLTGKKFGRLTVIKKAGSTKKGYATWLCKCDCGNEIIVCGYYLRSGDTKSCGCLKNEKFTKMVTKHNLINTNARLYQIWQGIKKRCYNPKCKSYKNYGAKGIIMCDEWKNDFKTFHDWAYANGYDENAKYMECTIDRINNNGNYEPNNCRWITNKEQALNKRKTIKITYKNETLPLKIWSEKLKINYETLRNRLKYYNWSIEKAFTTPVKQKKVKNEHTKCVK